MILSLGIMLTGCDNKAEETAITTESETVTGVQGIDVFGEVKVGTTREIVVDFPATVEKIHIKDGQMVKKGDKIITLNIDEYETNILKKENEIALYEGQLHQLQQNINPLSGEVDRLNAELSIKRDYLQADKDPDVKALKRSLEIAASEADTAKKEYEVSKEIFGIGGISPKELEDAKQSLNSKEKEKKDLAADVETVKTNRKLEVNQLNAALKNNQAQITNTDKQNETAILDLQSKLKMTKVDLDLMKKKLAKSYIKEKAIIADIDNMIIYDIACNEGTIVGQGESEAPLIKSMDENTLYISVDIPEEFISQVAINSEAEIVPYASKEASIKGKVIRLADRAIKQNGETIIKADIALEGKNSILKPGLTVDVKISK